MWFFKNKKEKVCSTDDVSVYVEPYSPEILELFDITLNEFHRNVHNVDKSSNPVKRRLTLINEDGVKVCIYHQLVTYSLLLPSLETMYITVGDKSVVTIYRSDMINSGCEDMWENFINRFCRIVSDVDDIKLKSSIDYIKGIGAKQNLTDPGDSSNVILQATKQR